MIKEALEALFGIARQSATPVEVYADPFVRRVVIDGRVEEIAKAVPPREHNVSSLAEVIELANRFKEGTANPVIWYDENAAVLVIDDDGHRVNTATLTLAASDVFKTICDLRRTKPWFEQKPFVRLLRIDLAGTLDAGILLNAVRKVAFTTSGTTTGVVKRYEESMGREINSQIASQGDIPETVILRVPIYKTAGERQSYGLNCAVEIDHEQHRFQLVPLPDEIERVQQLAVESIRERLAADLEEGIPAYYGQP